MVRWQCQNKNCRTAVVDCLLLLLLSLLLCTYQSDALNVVLAGGSGKVGQAVATKLLQQTTNDIKLDKITILSRNTFLAATPSRVSSSYGWIGDKSVLLAKQNSHVVTLRDWDGGDLLDIVGSDWMGWQNDVFGDTSTTTVVVHLVGDGFGEHRTMACERLLRESLSYSSGGSSSSIHHITVNPTDEDLPKYSPGAITLKRQRIQQCEDMVSQNFPNAHTCLRVPAFKLDPACNDIVNAIYKCVSA